MDDALPFLQTPRLTLRLAMAVDVPAIVQYYEENRVFLAPWDPVRPPEFFTAAYWEAQVEYNIAAFHADQAINWFLFPRHTPSQVIGSLNAFQIVRRAAQYCIVGYNLAQTAQGHGYMTEALSAAIAYLFDVQHLHRVMANYLPRNQASANVLKRLGFTVEGYARDYLRINDRWEDHILTSLLNSNWREA